MAAEVDEFSNINDVGYLLTRLTLATANNEVVIKDAIVHRLREIGFLKEPRAGESISFQNLRDSVNKILGTAEAH